MYFQPRPANPPPIEYATDLKYTVRDRWFGGERRAGRELTADELPYLQGIIDCGGDAGVIAGEIAAAIREHGTVAVWIGEAEDSPYGAPADQAEEP